MYEYKERKCELNQLIQKRIIFDSIFSKCKNVLNMWLLSLKITKIVLSIQWKWLQKPWHDKIILVAI